MRKPSLPFRKKLLTSAILGAIAAQGAAAQDSPEQQLEEVLVTGTLIRGVEAVGSPTIG